MESTFHMRYRRLSFIVGWSAVALLAIVGFAAFGDPGPSANEVRLEAAEASLGHTSGNYAGLGFALLGDGSTSTQAGSAAPESDSVDQPAQATEEASAQQDEAAPGTIASPSSGWLSEVEVRVLVSAYFEPEDVNRAIRIAWCESRFDPTATDLRTGAVGLFQHLPRYWEERTANAGFAGAQPTDPEASVAAAAWAVYEGGGWDVFGCRG